MTDQGSPASNPLAGDVPPLPTDGPTEGAQPPAVGGPTAPAVGVLPTDGPTEGGHPPAVGGPVAPAVGAVPSAVGGAFPTGGASYLPTVGEAPPTGEALNPSTGRAATSVMHWALAQAHPLLEPLFRSLARRYHRLDKTQPWSKWDLSRAISGSEVPMRQLRDTFRHFFITALERGDSYETLDSTGTALSRLLEVIPPAWQHQWLSTVHQHEQRHGEGAPGLLAALVAAHLIARKTEIRKAAKAALDGLYGAPQGTDETPSAFMNRLRDLARDTQAHYLPELQMNPDTTVQGVWFLWRLRPEIRDYLIHSNDAGHPDPPALLYTADTILDLDARLEHDYGYTAFCLARRSPHVQALTAIEGLPGATPPRDGQRARNRRPAAEPVSPEARQAARERLWDRYGTGPRRAPRRLPREGSEAAQAFQDTILARVCYLCLASDHTMRDCPSAGQVRAEWSAFREEVMKGRPSTPNQPSPSQ